MKALTVQQPWAWAIVHGGKDVENRTQVWSYRGPLAIHAGARMAPRWERSPLVMAALRSATMCDEVPDGYLDMGAIIGLVDLVDVHRGWPTTMANGTAECCASPWAEIADPGDEEHGRGIVHLVLENPRPLDHPIPCRGALGLWTPPADALAQLEEVTSA